MEPEIPQVAGIEREIDNLERKLKVLRGKQAAWVEWEKSRRPIRIGFRIVIPIVLAIEGAHLYLTLGRTQGGRAPWLMGLAIVAVAALSFWYYRQAKVQRDNVLMGFSRAAETAERIEARIEELKSRASSPEGQHE